MKSAPSFLSASASASRLSGDPNSAGQRSSGPGSNGKMGGPAWQAATQESAGPSAGMSLQGSQPSIADSRGRNWALQGRGRGAVPIRRPIRVVVRSNQVALLPTRHASTGAEATGRTISLEQSADAVSTQFVDALRERVGQWGLAGNGLYWRPVLELTVGPDAQQSARRVLQLLEDSGVEIQLPETAQGGGTRATR